MTWNDEKLEELIVCPKCERPTIKEREVYSKETKEVKLEERFKKRKSYYDKFGEPFSGDVSYVGFHGSRKPSQLVYECSACGYTEVYNL